MEKKTKRKSKEKTAKKSRSYKAKYKNEIEEAPGDFLNYRLGDKIGQGAFGTVYRAQHKKTSDLYAVKVIKCSRDEKEMKEVSQEIELMKKLNHENIIKYIDSYRTENYLYIVMEHAAGGSLYSLIDQFEIEEKMVAEWIYQMLLGLEYLHGQSVIHNDIKAANILFSTDRNIIKLSDFGISYKMDDTNNVYNDITGSAYWMAPEVIGGDPKNEKCDIWSLGITAIEIFTGKPPYFKFDKVVALNYIYYDGIKPDSYDKKDKMTPEFRNFLEKCLAKEVKERPSAEDLLKHEWFKQHLTEKFGLPGRVSEEKGDTHSRISKKGRIYDLRGLDDAKNSSRGIQNSLGPVGEGNGVGTSNYSVDGQNSGNNRTSNNTARNSFDVVHSMSNKGLMDRSGRGLTSDGLIFNRREKRQSKEAKEFINALDNEENTSVYYVLDKLNLLVKKYIKCRKGTKNIPWQYSDFLHSYNTKMTREPTSNTPKDSNNKEENVEEICKDLMNACDSTQNDMRSFIKTRCLVPFLCVLEIQNNELLESFIPVLQKVISHGDILLPLCNLGLLQTLMIYSVNKGNLLSKNVQIHALETLSYIISNNISFLILISIGGIADISSIFRYHRFEDSPDIIEKVIDIVMHIMKQEPRLNYGIARILLQNNLVELLGDILAKITDNEVISNILNILDALLSRSKVIPKHFLSNALIENAFANKNFNRSNFSKLLDCYIIVSDEFGLGLWSTSIVRFLLDILDKNADDSDIGRRGFCILCNMTAKIHGAPPNALLPFVPVIYKYASSPTSDRELLQYVDKTVICMINLCRDNMQYETLFRTIVEYDFLACLLQMFYRSNILSDLLSVVDTWCSLNVDSEAYLIENKDTFVDLVCILINNDVNNSSCHNASKLMSILERFTRLASSISETRVVHEVVEVLKKKDMRNFSSGYFHLLNLLVDSCSSPKKLFADCDINTILDSYKSSESQIIQPLISKLKLYLSFNYIL